MTFSPDGRHLLVWTGPSPAIHILSVPELTEVSVWLGDSGKITDVRYSCDGRHIVSVGWDGIRVWPVENVTRNVPVLAGHRHGISKTLFSPEDDWLVTASEDGTVRVWDTTTGVQRACLKHVLTVCDIDFSGDGTKLFSTDGTTVFCWSTDSWKRRRKLVWRFQKRHVRAISAFSNGSRVAFVLSDGGVGIWNTEKGHNVVPLDTGGEETISIVASDALGVIVAGCEKG
ncbi:MAG TPA: WD40 repeat domain-containing protein, partial [Candidatus Cryosericum sp.]|nr:WD40 repeat domain-containing protein [Candidatus Cryosericum sp.]